MAEHALELGEGDAALDPELVLGDHLDRRDLVGVALVLDLAHDLLENVLQRDDAGRAAELVDHDREMARAPLEVAQLAVERLALGHEGGGADERLPGRAVAAAGGQDVLGVDHARDRVGMAVVDQQPGVLGAPERRGDLLAVGRRVDGDDVDAGRHHLGHGRVGQREDAEQHVALGGAGVVRRPSSAAACAPGRRPRRPGGAAAGTAPGWRPPRAGRVR